MAVAEVVVVEVVVAAAAAGTATRTTDMVAATMAMATRAAVVTDGNGPFARLLPLSGTVSAVHSGLEAQSTHACLFFTPGQPSLHSLCANRPLGICYV